MREAEQAAPVRAHEQAATDFIGAQTTLRPVPAVPELRVHLADDAFALWERTDERAARPGPVPYWAFAWSGGQALARHLLDHASLVAGRDVVEVGAGCGVAAIAAARVGAASVLATDPDALAVAAIGLNAAANGVAVSTAQGSVDSIADVRADVVVAGDVFYEEALARAALGCFDALLRRGVRVLIGDPGRAFLPSRRLRGLASYEIPATAATEESDFTSAAVYDLLAG